MDAPLRQFAVIGLGRMGGGLARQALAKGYRVAGLSKDGVPPDLVKAGLQELKTFEALRGALTPPRLVLLYVPAGAAVDELLARLGHVLERGDIVADGGNSYWGDSIRRHRDLRRQGLHFVDVGTSGGVSGARDGACFMAGGDADVVKLIEPVLRALAVPDGYVYAGGPGSGHFVKLVHNGIEFGMLQAIGEGLELLARYPDKVPIVDVLKCWRHGSVIRSWLIDLMEQRYREDGIKAVPPVIEDTGEVNWLVDDAMHLEVPIPVIAQAVMQLIASRDEGRESARAVAMMRRGFGGHPYGRDAAVARERHDSRIGGFPFEAGPPKERAAPPPAAESTLERTRVVRSR